MAALAVNTDRLREVIDKGFESGGHNPSDGEMCVMEAAAYVAGEEWTDNPKCVCPVIAVFLRSWNDSLPAEDRTRLLGPLLPKVIGTRASHGVMQRRSWMAADWLVRECCPAFMELTEGLRSHAAELRALPELTPETARESKGKREAAWAAAGAAAGDAARAAAGAGDAARAAAGDAARAAAGDAAGDGEAAWAAAWAAARAAAGDGLKPKVSTLQESAAQLVERMAAV